MNPDVLAVAFELTGRQHGVVGVWQLVERGIGFDRLRNALRARRLIRLTSQVLSVPGMPLTDQAQAFAAVFDAGPRAVLSHGSAAAWWGIRGYHLTPAHTTRPYGTSSRTPELGVLHEVRDMPESLLACVDGLPVGRPELVLFQLAGVVAPDRLARAIDDAWSQGLVDGRAMRRCLDLMRDRGRKGTVAFREALEARPDGYVPPQSGAEARFAFLLEQIGEEPMYRQVDVAGGVGWIGRVDFHDRSRPFVVEILSERYHASLVDREDDARRFASLRATGRVVVGFWDFQLWRQGEAVARIVRRIRLTLDAGVPVDGEPFDFTLRLHERTADGSSLDDAVAIYGGGGESPF